MLIVLMSKISMRSAQQQKKSDKNLPLFSIRGKKEKSRHILKINKQLLLNMFLGHLMMISSNICKIKLNLNYYSVSLGERRESVFRKLAKILHPDKNNHR